MGKPAVNRNNPVKMRRPHAYIRDQIRKAHAIGAPVQQETVMIVFNGHKKK